MTADRNDEPPVTASAEDPTGGGQPGRKTSSEGVPAPLESTAAEADRTPPSPWHEQNEAAKRPTEVSTPQLLGDTWLEPQRPPRVTRDPELWSGPWGGDRRSVRRQLSDEAIGQAIRATDVDARPLDRRPQAGINPWDSVTSAGEVEGRVAMKVLGDLRRNSCGVEAIERPHYGLLWWLCAAGVVGLMVFAALALYRTKVAADGAEPISRLEVAKAPVDRSELRDRMFAAFRDGNYNSAVELGGRLESAFPLYREEEFVLAEAARLNRRYDDAVRRYSEFIQRHPNTVRMDDAQFWMAEAMRLQGNLEGARRYYRVVVDNRRSNVRDLAEKRLAQLD